MMDETTEPEATGTQEEATQSEITTVLISLPEEVFRREQDYYAGSNFQITFKSEIAYLWLVAQAPPGVTKFFIESDSVPGDLPVGCCANEWDIVNNKPTYNSVRTLELVSVERRDKRVRAKVRANTFVSHIAVGCVFAI